MTGKSTSVAVTGGARGIGLAIAQHLARRGERVAIGDIDGDLANAAAATIEGALGMALDVADADAFDRFLDVAEDALGPVDVLVNNAGIMPIGPFLEQDEALARRAVDINVHGPLNGMRAALPRMLDQGGGHIVNIASTAGKVATPGTAIYNATKFAVVGMSDAIRQEYAPHGIHVTTVMPSFTNTELIAGTKGLRGVPNIEPDDVAAAVLRALDRKPATVVVPGFLRASIAAHELLPTRAQDALARLYRADRVFLEIDHAQRRPYETRIAAHD